MVTRSRGVALLGRSDEIEALGRLLAKAREGRSGVLVMVGEPGVGKTAVLEHLIESAPEFRIARAVGVEWEMELPFAAVQQVCAPMLDRLEGLPDPQRDALGVALGLSAGEAPDRFLVGLAVLSLISQVAEEQPLLCVVDDAQWLDRASSQALAFVARRLFAERVVLVFAARKPSDELRGLPELNVQGLRSDDARALLDSVLGAPVDARVRERILVETHGNPLALLELPRGLTTAELTGGFGLPVALPLPGRIEESFRRRVDKLPAETQRLLLVAAAEPIGDPALICRAAAQLGIDPAAADPAEADGLLEIGTGLTFRHPLVRSAVCRAASAKEKRAVHEALAAATDPNLDPDHRAWHRAQATTGPDEDVAIELEQAAVRAQARGGFAAAAAFLERAAGLTLDPAARAQRALAAARAKHQAGALDAALALLATAEAGTLDELQRAQADVLRAQILFASNRGSDAPPLLLKAAKRLEPFDIRLARETYLYALSAALFAGRLAKSGGIQEVAEAVRVAPHPPPPVRASDLLLDGMTLLITDGHAAGAPILKQALNAVHDEEISSDEGLRLLWLAGRAAVLVWDYESWDAVSARLVQLARDAGALSVLPIALTARSGVHVFAGELDVASSLAGEVDAITEATGSTIAPLRRPGVVAFRGREAEAHDLIEATKTDLRRRGEGMGLLVAEWAKAVLYNGLGRYDDALAAAQQLTGASHAPGLVTSGSAESMWGLVELIEAATRSGNPEAAVDTFDRLAATTRAGGTDWALGIEARSRALLDDGKTAETSYLEAIDRLGRTRLRVDLARAHLLYGEWLRRERRRLDAREQLRTAHEMFTEFGTEAFAERARVELEATGEHARKRAPEALGDLSPQEAQISRLAAEGATNQEIAARLYISSKTVEYHLRKSFRKLGVKSRTQLAHHLLEPAARHQRAAGEAEGTHS